jgi:hypothetical protein
MIAMSYPGFYKFTDDLLQYAGTSVYAPGFTLTAANHADYIYPVDDWYWFDSRQIAEAFWGINGQSDAQWVQFGSAVQASEAINQLLGTALQQLPALGLGLGVGLGKAADGDARVFLDSWSMARGLGLISDQLLAGVLSMAQGFDLPAAFTEALTVPPPAQNLGQEWTSPTGTIYRVAQAAGEDGQFLPDDPQTPPRESLRWVVVEP